MPTITVKTKSDEGTGGPADDTIDYGELAIDGDGDLYAGIPNGVGVTKTVRIGGVHGAFDWSTVTGTSQTIAINSGYFANNAGVVTFTLPTAAAVGDKITIIGKGAGGWKIAQSAGQTIYVDTSSTTTGVTGTIDGGQYESITLICSDATSTDWIVTSSTGVLTFN